MGTDNFRSERNHGIDLLRVLLSFCVITLHILYYGGFYTHAEPTSFGFYLLWILGITIDCTVNCFAILSGYVLYDRQIKYANLFHLFLTVLFHGLFITILFQVIQPGSVTVRNFIQVLLPVSHSAFWYFTAYFGAFFFFPVLQQGISSLSKKQADLLVISLILIFSALPTVTTSDPFHASYGYSVLWILVLFVIGAYLKKYRDTLPLSKGKLILLFAGCILITAIGAGLSRVITVFDGMELVEYTSPTIVFAAIAAVLLFSSLQIPARIHKIARFCIPATFSIYLLHEHPLIRQHIIADRFVPLLSLPTGLQLLAVLASTLAIWLVCFGLDLIRQAIFRFLEVDKMLQGVEQRLTQKKQKEDRQ